MDTIISQFVCIFLTTLICKRFTGLRQDCKRLFDRWWTTSSCRTIPNQKKILSFCFSNSTWLRNNPPMGHFGFQGIRSSELAHWFSQKKTPLYWVQNPWNIRVNTLTHPMTFYHDDLNEFLAGWQGATSDDEADRLVWIRKVAKLVRFHFWGYQQPTGGFDTNFCQGALRKAVRSQQWSWVHFEATNCRVHMRWETCHQFARYRSKWHDYTICSRQRRLWMRRGWRREW